MFAENINGQIVPDCKRYSWITFTYDEIVLCDKYFQNINGQIAPDEIVLSEQYFQMTLINKW